MESLKQIGRITLGLVLITSGALLLFHWNPSNTLPNLLSAFEPLKPLAPHYLAYFKVNAGLFCLAGVLAILNMKISALAQALGSLMFIMTYDNPMLYDSWDGKVQRAIFIMCHLAVIAALWQCGAEEKPGREAERAEAKVVKSD